VKNLRCSAVSLKKNERLLFMPEMQKFLNKIHSVGYVHGDFREYNIMCNLQTGKVKVVDFEFSGKEDAVYPVPLNTRIHWPAGVEFRGHLNKQHDLVFFEWHQEHKSSEKTPSDSV